MHRSHRISWLCACVPTALIVILLLLAIAKPGPVSASPRSLSLATLIVETSVIAIAAVGVAAPFALGASIFWHEFAPHPIWRRAFDLFAAIPGVLFAYAALRFIAPIAEEPETTIRYGLTLGLLGTYLIAPFALLTYAAIQGVPDSLRETAVALGARRLTALRVVVLPAARPALLAATALVLARALSEAVLIALLLRLPGPDRPITLAAALLEDPRNAPLPVAVSLTLMTLSCHLAARWTRHQRLYVQRRRT